MRARDIFKEAKPLTLNENETVENALELLLGQKANGLIIVNGSGKIVGVLSMQDIASAVVPDEFKKNVSMAYSMYREGFFEELCQELKKKKVKKIMRKDFIQVDIEDNIMAIITDFLKNDLYMVPVFEKKKLVGVITRSQVKRALALGMEIPLEEV